MKLNAPGMALLTGLLCGGSASAAQLTLQQGLNGYTGYTHAEIKGYSVDESATTLWELKMGNCVT